MTQSEKLEALIQKAIDDGWKPDFIPDWKNLRIAEDQFLMSGGGIILTSINTVLFNHDFAKALFNASVHIAGFYEGATYGNTDQRFHLMLWQYHLQQAVISEDPIGYMYAVFNTKEN